MFPSLPTKFPFSSRNRSLQTIMRAPHFTIRYTRHGARVHTTIRPPINPGTYRFSETSSTLDLRSSRECYSIPSLSHFCVLVRRVTVVSSSSEPLLSFSFSFPSLTLTLFLSPSSLPEGRPRVLQPARDPSNPRTTY